MKHRVLILKYIVKYVPMLICALCSAHCGLLLGDIDLMVMRIMTQLSPFVLILFLWLSYTFKYCMLHRLMIIYNFAVNLCIVANRLDVFEFIGIDLFYPRLTMCLIGVVLMVAVVVQVCYEKCKRK